MGIEDTGDDKAEGYMDSGWDTSVRFQGLLL